MNWTQVILGTILGWVLGGIILVIIIGSIEYVKNKRWQRKEMKEFLEYKKITDERLGIMNKENKK